METSKCILLIEDNKHDQFFFNQAIQQIEYASMYHVANNGREALDILDRSKALPDIIFTDINMPVMDGVECLSEIVKTPKIKDIPVVVLSSDTSKIEILTEMGVKVFIEKPADSRILKTLIEYVLSMEFMIKGCMSKVKLQKILSSSN